MKSNQTASTRQRQRRRLDSFFFSHTYINDQSNFIRRMQMAFDEEEEDRIEKRKLDDLMNEINRMEEEKNRFFFCEIVNNLL